MFQLSTSTLAWLAGAWLIISVAVTALTWLTARTRVESPLAVTACNCLLSIFPPFNLLVLTLLIAMQRRCPPSAFAMTREPGPPPGRNDAPRCLR